MTNLPFRMIEDNLDVDLVTEKTINIINEWLKEKQIKQNDVQIAMLYSHIHAMVNRAKRLESLPNVDPALFNELSDESMALAHKTVNLFNNLSMDEAYLLAVHFEVARENDNQ